MGDLLDPDNRSSEGDFVWGVHEEDGTSLTSEQKIDTLITNPQWREKVKRYAVMLLDKSEENGEKRIKELYKDKYLPALKAMISQYRSEMK